MVTNFFHNFWKSLKTIKFFFRNMYKAIFGIDQWKSTGWSDSSSKMELKYVREISQNNKRRPEVNRNSKIVQHLNIYLYIICSHIQNTSEIHKYGLQCFVQQAVESNRAIAQRMDRGKIWMCVMCEIMSTIRTNIMEICWNSCATLWNNEINQ